MTKKKKFMLSSIIILFALILVIIGSDYYVQSTAQDQLYEDLDALPYNKVGLLLGTVKMNHDSSRLNPYYQYRIEAASQLFKAGKIEFILVSGDNSRRGYDEPTDMKEDLIKMGVPKSKIVLDFAGFRTLDSVVRCKEIFGQSKITIISQKFHNERAIFIASKKGIDAVGFAAQDVSRRYGIKVMIREKFARVKMMLDLLFGVGPKFLGENIEIK